MRPERQGQPVITARDISKSFGASGAQAVFENLDLTVNAGDFTVVMGPSGAGKSTLLYVLSGMDRPTSGSVLFEGVDLMDLGEADMARLRANRLGFVFQRNHLVGDLTLFENVVVAGYLAQGSDGAAVRERATELLEGMGVAQAAGRLPSDVSGGEAQRAAVARAVINSPAMLFADEPTGSLNRRNSVEVLDLLSQLNESGQSILMVTHDQHAAERGNRILYFADGRVESELDLGFWNEGDRCGRGRVLADWLAEREW